MFSVMNKNNKNKNKNKKKRPKTGFNERLDLIGSPYARNGQIYKAPAGTIMPDQLECELIYQDGNQARASITNNYGYWGYRANSAYDVDLLTTSSGMSGFAELAQFYQFYRVDRCAIHMEVSNKDSTVFTFCIIPANFAIASSVSSRAVAIDYAENAREVTKTLAPVGSPPCILNKAFDIGTVYGNRMQQRNDINFSAATSANPFQVIYAHVVYWTDGTVPTIGFAAATTLKLTVRFFHRVPLAG